MMSCVWSHNFATWEICQPWSQFCLEKLHCTNCIMNWNKTFRNGLTWGWRETYSWYSILLDYTSKLFFVFSVFMSSNKLTIHWQAVRVRPAAGLSLGASDLRSARILSASDFSTVEFNVSAAIALFLKPFTWSSIKATTEAGILQDCNCNCWKPLNFSLAQGTLDTEISETNHLRDHNSLDLLWGHAVKVVQAMHNCNSMFNYHSLRWDFYVT